MNFSLWRNVSHRNRNCERHPQGSSTITAVFKWHDYYCKQLFLSEMITFNSTIKLPPAPDSSSIIQQYKCTSPGLLSRAHRHIMFGRHKNKCIRVNKLTWCRMLKLIPFSLQFHGISLPTWCTKMHYEIKKPKKLKDFPGGVVKNLPANSGDARNKGFDPWFRKIPWRRKWQPTPVFFPGKLHRQRSLVGHTSWGLKESDMTEHTYNKNKKLNGKS